MRLSSLFTGLYVLASLPIGAFANPIPDGISLPKDVPGLRSRDPFFTDLEKRNYPDDPAVAPTVERCKEVIRPNMGPDMSMFYTSPLVPKDSNGKPDRSKAFKAGLEAYRVIKNYYKKSAHVKFSNYKRVTEIVPKDFHKVWLNNPDQEKIFWRHCSQAMAELTQGTAYVMMEKANDDCEAKQWYDKSVWEEFEYHNLPDGVKVLRIHPHDPKEWPLK